MLAFAIAFVLARRQQDGKTQANLAEEGEQLVFTVQFEIAEVRSIRSLLGPSIADALMHGLAKRITSLAGPSEPPNIDLESVTLRFDASAGIDPGLQIEKALDKLRQKISVSGIEFCCSVSANVVSHGMGASEVLQHRSTDHGTELKLDLLRELTGALVGNELNLEYQPKLDLRAGSICSAEALLRWRRGDGTQVDIGELISLAERTGTIKELSLWTVRRAIADGELMRCSGSPTEIFVNISGGLLGDSDFADRLLAAVAATDAKIGIEITETAVIADPDVAIRHLQKIAKAGISIAIDDFGVGLSSLEYLQQLPAAELKIDRNFIATLSSSNRNPLIVKASIDLAHALEMKVTAEGVDDALSLSLLKVMGCDMVQGYLISPALPVLQLVEFMNIYQAAARQGDVSEVTPQAFVGPKN